MDDFVPAEPFPPGEYLRDELNARGWTQADLARIIGRPIQMVNEILKARRAITPPTAKALAEALGTNAETWLRLEAAYQLALENTPKGAIQRRAMLYEIAPVREMERRGWIRPTTAADDLEAELKRFYGAEDLCDLPDLPVAARATANKAEPPVIARQRAWCMRAFQLADALQVRRFRRDRVKSLIHKLRTLAAYPKEARHVPELLAEHGIRFVVVERLRGGHIDGAAFGTESGSPAIALSFRYGRMDWFWFTVMHELSHVLHGDNGGSLDVGLVGSGAIPVAAKAAEERRADNEASDWLIPQQALESFIRRVSPMYYKPRIIQFSHAQKIHPAITVGQLQHRGEISWRANREMLADVRDIVTSVALTDGFGHRLDPEVLS